MLIKEKIELIDFARQRFGIKSFADLGGTWGVDGAYSFYALESGIERGYLVDSVLSDKVLSEKQRFLGLTLIQGDFGSEAVTRQMEYIDVVFLFDVLLHQVTPNWDDILDLYATRTNLFLIFNQQFIASERTVRLLDLGKEEYLRNVPGNRDAQTYSELFERMYEIHPTWRWDRRIYRNVPNVWQWGITDHDLFNKMKSLGFGLQYYKNCGQFGDLKNFENHAFAFRK
jgi:hypothetical protein